MGIKRKKFDMTNPYGADGREVRVTADPEVLDYLKSLDYVSIYGSIGEKQLIIDLSPLYDIDDAWLAVYDELEAFCNRVELDESIWGNVLPD